MYSPKLLRMTKTDQIPKNPRNQKNELFQEIKLRMDNRKNRKTLYWNLSQFISVYFPTYMENVISSN